MASRRYWKANRAVIAATDRRGELPPLEIVTEPGSAWHVTRPSANDEVLASHRAISVGHSDATILDETPDAFHMRCVIDEAKARELGCSKQARSAPRVRGHVVGSTRAGWCAP